MNNYGDDEDFDINDPRVPTQKQLLEHDLQNEKHDSEDWTLY